MIENVLLPRELRYPANDWGQTPVVCGKSTFSRGIAVPDAGALIPASSERSPAAAVPAYLVGVRPRVR